MKKNKKKRKRKIKELRQVWKNQKKKDSIQLLCHPMTPTFISSSMKNPNQKKQTKIFQLKNLCNKKVKRRNIILVTSHPQTKKN